MAKRDLQEINAGSMADIAFLLLIFFLVTTTMDKDWGIIRQLPPLDDTNIQIERNDRDVLVVIINEDNKLMIENKNIPVYKDSDTNKLVETGRDKANGKIYYYYKDT